MAAVLEFYGFLMKRKKFWLIPIFVVLFIVGGLLLITQGTVVAPLIYTLF